MKSIQLLAKPARPLYLMRKPGSTPPRYFGCGGASAILAFRFPPDELNVNHGHTTASVGPGVFEVTEEVTRPPP